jgi:hypothetical protein
MQKHQSSNPHRTRNISKPWAVPRFDGLCLLYHYLHTYSLSCQFAESLSRANYNLWESILALRCNFWCRQGTQSMWIWSWHIQACANMPDWLLHLVFTLFLTNAVLLRILASAAMNLLALFCLVACGCKTFGNRHTDGNTYKPSTRTLAAHVHRWLRKWLTKSACVRVKIKSL